jgi:hypothetical protein
MSACWCIASVVGLATSIRLSTFSLRDGVRDLFLTLVFIVGD